MIKKPKGYFKNFLAIDVETTGLSWVGHDPTHDPNTNDTFQIVSFGALVVGSDDLVIKDELYREIKWNKMSKWSSGAENIHGLSKEHLEKNGVSEEEGVLALGELILKYWSPDSPVCLMGHNVASFDKFFVDKMFKNYGISIKFSARTIDTNAIGFVCFNTYTSNELFDMIAGKTRDNHNSLEDIKLSLEVVRAARNIVNELL